MLGRPRVADFKVEKDGVTSEIQGLHHITIVGSNADRVVRFYRDILGLKFVKKTVNFDQPDTYHLYFGRDTGAPGTLVTFFIWPHSSPGRLGIGSTHHFALQTSTYDALLKWKAHLQRSRIFVAGPFDHGSFRDIIVRDSDGVLLEIVALKDNGSTQRAKPERHALVTETWPDDVPSISGDMSLRGLQHVALVSSDIDRAAAFYEDLLGASPRTPPGGPDTESAQRRSWDVGASGSGCDAILTCEAWPAESPTVHAEIGHGLPHHIAFAVEGEESLLGCKERLERSGIPVSGPIDRQYYRSIHFRDPDGHVIEIATSGPGFLVDQTRQQLGNALALPPQLEDQRAEIESELSPLSEV